jgi:hypothetical protein
MAWHFSAYLLKHMLLVGWLLAQSMQAWAFVEYESLGKFLDFRF